MGNYSCGCRGWLSAYCPPKVIDISKLDLFCSIDDATELGPLIDYIEQLLSRIKKEHAAQNIRIESEMPMFVKDSIGDASKFMEAISTNGEALNKENIWRKLPADMENVISSALEAVGRLHWVAVGFSIIAFVLQKIEQVSSNFSKCVEILDIMLDISKRLKVLHERMPNEHEALKKAVCMIVEGAIWCCCCMAQGKFFRYLSASTNEAKLENIEKVIAKLYRELGLIIAMDIQRRIPRPYYSSEYRAPVNAVGIDGRIQEVIELLNLCDKGPARAVILYGFGGVGKTTLADCVMPKLDLTGFKHSRIQLDDNISDIQKYQEQLYADLSGEIMAFKNSDEGKQKLKEILEMESTFILIDNALTKDHINNLLPSELSLPSESRMLLTSRKLDVIEEFRFRRIDCKGYHVKELPHESAREYFREIVLRSEEISSAISSNGINLAQIDAVAKKCHGVPLLLRVYGQYLERHGADPDIYDDMLRTLEGGNFNVDGEVNLSERLLYVYRRFDQNHQDAFVDICTYFHGWEKDDVSFIIGKPELNALLDGALVDMDAASKVTVHDVLRAMGIKEGKETRVNNGHDLKATLAQKKELNRMKGLWLLESQDSDVIVESQHLMAMGASLRVLALGRQIRVNGGCDGSLSAVRFLHIEDLDKVPILDTKLRDVRYIMVKYPKYSPSVPSPRMWENIKNLRYIQKLVFHCSKLKKIPSGFSFPESLVELDLSRCRDLQELPHELGMLTKLKKLTLEGCARLTFLPAEFGKLSSLRRLDLSYCSDLKELPESFESLTNLQQLFLTGCENLEKFSDALGKLASLKEFNIDSCRSMKKLPANFGGLSSLQSLDLKNLDSLTELPESFGNLSELRSLKIDSCESLTSLSINFGQLKSLKTFEVCKCSKLTKLPEHVYDLTALEELHLIDLPLLSDIPIRFAELRCLRDLRLCGCKRLKSLPNEFGNLKALKSLHLTGCESLKNLPDGFGNLHALESLHISLCNSLMGLPNGFGALNALKSLVLSGCEGLRTLPDGFVNLRNLKSLDLSGCENLQILPDGFGNLKTLQSLDLSGCKSLQSLPEGFDNLKSLKSLKLSGCESLKCLPNGFGNMESLESLNLNGCKNLQSLSDGFNNLKALKALDLNGCESLKSLPDIFGHLKFQKAES